MEVMASVDSCPPTELAALMARAKTQTAHLFQIKALYMSIKQQAAQLRSLVEAGTGKRAPNLAPKQASLPFAKPSAAKPSAARRPMTNADVDMLKVMNAKLMNEHSKLEAITARLARV